jgi:outer membrane receptor for ferrienterochelin and colicins
MNKIIIVFFFLMAINAFAGTDANVFGDVQSNGQHLIFVTIEIPELKMNTVTDKTGHYKFVNLKPGVYKILAKMIGYETQEKIIKIESGKTIEVNFELTEKSSITDEVVVTANKTKKIITESAVKVDVMNSDKIELVQANNLSESLNYIPGLRLEIDCQTCNYSQLRMNGLGGAYSQILINGKSIFSPLTGLYGLEQIPANMIDKIEVTKGGGSAIFGSSAIGGTVNIITKTPSDDSYSISNISQSINGSVLDNQLLANTSVMNDNRRAGISLFASKRERGSYDANNDGFSELPSLINNSFGLNAYIRPDFNHRIELSASSMYELRRGGDQMNLPAHQAEQSEERTHNVFMSSLDYEYYFNDFFSSFSTYIGFQSTKRDHYTGIIPDINGNDSSAYFLHFLNPPYGKTKNSTFQSGIRLNHLHKGLSIGDIDATAGLDFLYDDVFDEIRSYNFEIDQITQNIGFFLQTDWKILSNLILLAGLRFDQHNLINHIIMNPRLSLLWDIIPDFQYRFSWASGFRAPQAFDADLHIAFAGGGIQFIQLHDNLKEETSQSVTSSLIYDIFQPDFAIGFTIDGFYTLLKDAFILEEVALADDNSILEKRNGGNSYVLGTTFDFRYNYKQALQIEASLTIQDSKYKNEVFWSEQLKGTFDYLRTPSRYGYATFSYSLNSLNFSITGTYTGSMLVPHYGVNNNEGTPELDVLKETDQFVDLGTKISYKVNLEPLHSDFEIYAGIKNILNAYQNDFDKGKYRDSGYIYGPSLPRTFYLGIKFER